MNEVIHNESVISSITNYIQNAVLGKPCTYNSKTLIFREGILDSMGFVLLIDFIENTYCIKLNDEDLFEKNFESIEAIAQFINQKKGFC